MAKNIFADLDLRQNELKQGVIDHVSSFPAGAREGQVIYHTGLKSFFICKNPLMIGGTTQKGAWGIGEVDSETELKHTGDPNKILVSNSNGGFDLNDVDGGTF